MKLEYIKIILFIVAFIFPFLLLSKVKDDYEFSRFLKMILTVHIILLLVVIFKLHHLFRARLSIPNTVTYLVSAIPLVLFLVKFYKQKSFHNTVFLMISLFFLGSAVFIDLITDGRIIDLANSNTIEECLRITGAFFWFIYNLIIYLRFKERTIK